MGGTAVYNNICVDIFTIFAIAAVLRPGHGLHISMKCDKIFKIESCMYNQAGLNRVEQLLFNLQILFGPEAQ